MAGFAFLPLSFGKVVGTYECISHSVNVGGVVMILRNDRTP